ncbi:MAG: hypothetical protein ABIP74_04560 [Candidatus Saccharimonas sp.]
MEEYMAMLGMLIVLACIIVPMAIVLTFLIVAAVIAVGAIIPMFISFCIGFLVKGIYRVFTSVPPRRAIIE